MNYLICLSRNWEGTSTRSLSFAPSGEKETDSPKAGSGSGSGGGGGVGEEHLFGGSAGGRVLLSFEAPASGASVQPPDAPRVSWGRSSGMGQTSPGSRLTFVLHPLPDFRPHHPAPALQPSQLLSVRSHLLAAAIVQTNNPAIFIWSFWTPAFV